MTCFECAKDITAYPCACGYQPRGLQAQAQWFVTHCSTPGCFTAIRMKLGQQEATPMCKWCVNGESHAKHGKAAVDPRMHMKESA